MVQGADVCNMSPSKNAVISSDARLCLDDVTRWIYITSRDAACGAPSPTPAIGAIRFAAVRSEMKMFGTVGRQLIDVYRWRRPAFAWLVISYDEAGTATCWRRWGLSAERRRAMLSLTTQASEWDPRIVMFSILILNVARKNTWAVEMRQSVNVLDNYSTSRHIR